MFAFYLAASAGLLLNPALSPNARHPLGPHQLCRTGCVVASGVPLPSGDLSSDEFRDSFGGCKEDRQLDLNGVRHTAFSLSVSRVPAVLGALIVACSSD